MVLLVQLSWWAVYRSEAFEQYKVNSEPWPWQENREEWLKFLAKTIFIILVNYGGMVPLMIILNFQYITEYKVDFSYA